MAHDVFVSYSQKDKPIADAVVARLEQDGLRCWLASRDIVPGASWGEAIVNAISASRLMVLILSDNSNRSRQVVREVERAVSEGVVIVPFRIDGVDPTGAMAYFLATEHWLDAMTPPLEQHIERLAQTAGLLVSGEPVDSAVLDRPPRMAAAPRRPWWQRRNVLVAAGGSVVAIVAVVFVLVTLGNDATPRESPTGATPSAVASDSPAVTLAQVGQFRPSDLRDPTSQTPPGLVYGFAIDDSVLALANGVDGVTRVAIGDLTNPIPMDTFGVYDARAVAFAGDYICAVTGEQPATVTVFPTDGTGGVTLPEGTLSSGTLYNLAAADGYVYVASHDYVGIIDVTDPQNPTTAFEWQPESNTGNPANIFIDGGIGYFAAGWDGLYVFDLANPASPSLLGHWNSPDWIIDVVVVDGIAYAALGDSGLATVDVSDPTNPVMLGSVETPKFASDLDVGHGHAFVGMYGGASLGGIAVIDVSEPAAPVVVDTVASLQSVTDVEVVGDHLVVTEESQGVIVFEITRTD